MMSSLIEIQDWHFALCEVNHNCCRCFYGNVTKKPFPNSLLSQEMVFICLFICNTYKKELLSFKIEF